MHCVLFPQRFPDDYKTWEVCGSQIVERSESWQVFVHVSIEDNTRANKHKPWEPQKGKGLLNWCFICHPKGKFSNIAFSKSIFRKTYPRLKRPRRVFPRHLCWDMYYVTHSDSLDFNFLNDFFSNEFEKNLGFIGELSSFTTRRGVLEKCFVEINFIGVNFEAGNETREKIGNGLSVAQNWTVEQKERLFVHIRAFERARK